MEAQRAERKEDSLLLARSKTQGHGMGGSPGLLVMVILLVKNSQNSNIFDDTLGEEDDSYMDSNEIVSRTKFPESWLWTDMKLPPCPETKPNW